LGVRLDPHEAVVSNVLARAREDLGTDRPHLGTTALITVLGSLFGRHMFRWAAARLSYFSL
jgi:hypothetical protein